MAGLLDLIAAEEARQKAAQPPREPLPGNPKTLMEIGAAVSARLGQPWPPVQPDYDELVPKLPDNPTPAQVAAQRHAAHRLFMESVASPPPRRGRVYGR